MAGKSRSKSKQRSQGGGRTSNTEPRVQVFKGFAGMNFEHYPEMPAIKPIDGNTWNEDASQEDLVMTQFELLKNVQVANNMTLETTPDLINFDFGDEFNKKLLLKEVELTGPACLVGSYLFFAYNTIFKVENGDVLRSLKIGRILLGSKVVTEVKFYVGAYNLPTNITYITWAQNRLLVFDMYGQVWRSKEVLDEDYNRLDGEVGRYIDALYGAVYIPDPVDPIDFSMIVANGISLSKTQDDNHPYRIRLAYCINTMFGPTAVSPALILYSDLEIAEWNEEKYIDVRIPLDSKEISKFFPKDETYSTYVEFGALSASLYFTVDDAYEYQFAQMASYIDNTKNFTGEANIRWYGYLTDTSAWEIASLDAPRKNYTIGPKARYCTVIDGRIYFWGGGAQTAIITHEPPLIYIVSELVPASRILIGGNPGNMLNISPMTGGGFVDIDPGSGKFVRNVLKYKTVSGADIVTVLCGSPNSQQEYRYNLVSSVVSISQDNATTSWTAEHVSGSTGCINNLGALVCEDGLYTVSRYGLSLTTMAMEYNNQIRANYVSDPIKPVFIDNSTIKKYENRDFDNLDLLLYCDGIIYYGKRRSSDPYDLNTSVVFCYDVSAKAWWSITVPGTLRNIINIDSEKHAEGVAFICMNGIFVQPTTNQVPDYDNQQISEWKIASTAMISTTQPNHGYHHLTQVEFDFDYFSGDAYIEIVGIDIFGRKVNVSKKITYLKDRVYGLEVYLRVDLKLREYKVQIKACPGSEFRLNCFQSKLYVMNNRNGLVLGFDDMQSFQSDGDIQPTFKNYNDVVNAIIP